VGSLKDEQKLATRLSTGAPSAAKDATQLTVGLLNYSVHACMSGVLIASYQQWHSRKRNHNVGRESNITRDLTWLPSKF
jgi:hypothetical protein